MNQELQTLLIPIFYIKTIKQVLSLSITRKTYLKQNILTFNTIISKVGCQ